MSDSRAAGAASFLMMRKAGVTWAVAHPEVRGVAQRGGSFEVTLAGSLPAGAATLLTVDEVLGVAADLRLLPAGPVLRRYWPEAAHGLAVHGAQPMLLIDPQAPPRALLATAVTAERGSYVVNTPPVPRSGAVRAADTKEGRLADG